MNATVAKPETGHRLSRAELRRRWDELADDPLIAAIPYKVELNEKGVIEVSPPTTQHASLQFAVANALNRQRPEGKTFTECPVETEIGMRIPDVVWASAEFIRSHGDEKQFRVSRTSASRCCRRGTRGPRWPRNERRISPLARKKFGSSARTASQRSTPVRAE
jgi:hypothetical protein